ncbi:anticodon-binding protein [Neocallimastix lanati (nom. inval.)]|jgi:U3 small nucleolar ribonucleoprotein protein IMP4|uniref:U3 small nucleolar ribonucleoprotein protein IMP4 n=1 Tax=Neocallimastix californiae TaxID=1754190 RepID=A0A1Y2FCN4_9FUNG|nr:anticodon-binding protein [Neocallimastix sp. JGI-2020a]ORY81671.1 Brix-domain-containing protein [Neocallimastix californiae]|eukprot:ORY81671.1 Brix-domain-containing protein [Neocallimastix californiae]
MIRRNTRLRKEYIYRKALEAKDRQIFERKQALKNALAEGKQIPTELRNESETLKNDLLFDEHQEDMQTHIDDEYAQAGVHDPKVLITTSRDPSSRLQQFAKEMKLIFPNSQRINRGNYVIKDVVNACKSNEVTDLIILHEHRGQPDGMIVSHFPYGPTAYFTLNNVVLRHDIPDRGTVSEAYPHLIFNNFTTKLGTRVSNILKYLFPVPKDDSKRVITFANDSDYISFRHHVYYKIGQDIQLAEVGPRFEMKLYEIKLGTADITEADVEWTYRPYMNTTKKRDFL